MTLLEVHTIVQKCWSAEVSYKPCEWTQSNPSYGCCAVTAKLIHEMFGGKIMMGFFKHGSNEVRRHYWNVINDFTIDFTVYQFFSNEKRTELFFPREVDVKELITDPWMQERYDRFKGNFIKECSKGINIDLRWIAYC